MGVQRLSSSSVTAVVTLRWFKDLLLLMRSLSLSLATAPSKSAVVFFALVTTRSCVNE